MDKETLIIIVTTTKVFKDIRRTLMGEKNNLLLVPNGQQ